MSIEKDTLLNDLILKWKRCSPSDPEGKFVYTDVEAFLLDRPSDSKMEDECPHGCSLEIHKQKNNPSNWIAMSGDDDYYRQTRKCGKHRYARIYVIKGILLAEFPNKKS